MLAAELPADIGRLHAHFIHTPASVTRYAAMTRGLEWSVSAHAKDIWTTPDWEKREKLADASWAVTCTETGQQHLAALAPNPDRVALCYHGLDLASFPPAPRRDRAGGPVTVLSVGRAVAKKGYGDLLAALALLPPSLDWRFIHVGGGSLSKDLKAQADQLGLGGRVEWRGARPQPDVLAAYREADIFVLASKIAPDGDRDGLPNVLMEAQSQGLVCIATDLAGIPELIEDGVTGLLVPPADPKALAAALGRLAGDPALRERLGLAGERRVRAEFDAKTTIGLLASRFGLRPPAQPAMPARELVDAS